MHTTRLGLTAYVCLFVAIILLTALPGSAQTTPWGVNFYTIGLGGGASTTLTYSFEHSTAVGAAAVVTQGAPGLDFTRMGGTCVPKTYSEGETCTVDLNFTPAYPGLRMGAVVFKDTGGAVLSTTYIQGVGIGSLPTVPPASSAAGLSFQPMGVAVDAAGYTYVLDSGNGSGNGAVRQLGPGFVGLAVLASGFNYPVGVAVDGAGNVYVADSGAGSVWKVTPGGIKTQIAPTTSLDLYGVAVDGDGNLYIADRNTESVLKVAPDGNQSTVADNFQFVVGAIAVDGDGHIYVSDARGGCVQGVCTTDDVVWKVTPGGARTKVWTGSSQASGVAVDGAGNLYVTDGNLWKVAPGQAQEAELDGIVEPRLTCSAMVVRPSVTRYGPYTLRPIAQTTSTGPSRLAAAATGRVLAWYARRVRRRILLPP
jgi:sugar lactone lactonase YvrE